ncbi:MULTISPECIES: hypothetical protein [unclassified Shewanella]|uniref:hypothetical protein n=1 Tax=unclassified Shewanella TaxID=196818 RepID=UPI001A989B94|nr:hypothetical protein [Shewanella sp. 4t3-1-2LB]MBO1272043.1 hypothetical protein [Shewanella sp. 4t3-1-2LB]
MLTTVPSKTPGAEILLVQSRWQNICYRGAWLLEKFWLMLFGAVTVVCWHYPLFLLLTWVLPVASMLVLFGVITLWLMLFNRGDGKLIEFGVRLDNAGICIIRYGEPQFIAWSELQAYRLEPGLCWPRKFQLKLRDDSVVEFGYLCLSKRQRQQLCHELSCRLGQPLDSLS